MSAVKLGNVILESVGITVWETQSKELLREPHSQKAVNVAFLYCHGS